MLFAHSYLSLFNPLTKGGRINILVLVVAVGPAVLLSNSLEPLIPVSVKSVRLLNWILGVIPILMIPISQWIYKKRNRGSGMSIVLFELSAFLGQVFSMNSIGLGSDILTGSTTPLNQTLSFPIAFSTIILLYRHRLFFSVSGKYPVTNISFNEEITRDIPVFRACHISDIHFTTTKTMEGALDMTTTKNSLAKAMESIVKANPTLIFITGDLTDASEQGEWESLSNILENYGDEIFKKIIIIPGNHDLVTLRVKKLGDQFHEQENAANFFLKQLRLRANWEVCTRKGRKELSVLLDELDEYFLWYQDQRKKYEWVQLTHPRIGPGQDYPLRRELSAFALNWERKGYEWPNKHAYLIQELIPTLYPMVFYEDPSFIVVGLNSCATDTYSFTTSALGRLGKAQLNKLSDLLETVTEKCKLILVHHHLGLPKEKIKQFPRRYYDDLRLTDRKQLHSVLTKHQKVIVFNGHKHIGYHGSVNANLKIISAASITYEDKTDPSGCNCFIYDINSKSEVFAIELQKRPPSGQTESS